MTISQLCDYIILVAAVLIALKNIYEFFAKPTSKLKSKRAEEMRKEVNACLDEKLPAEFEKHNKDVEEKYNARKDEYLKEVKGSVMDELKEVLDKILEENRLQSESIEKLSLTTKDMLRQRIMAIYHANKKEKKLTVNEREILDELYKDYKGQGGNSYIDKYWKRMESWEIIPDDYQDE